MGGMDIFYEADSSPKTETQLCRLTCDRLNSFLPALKQEIFAVGKDLLLTWFFLEWNNINLVGLLCIRLFVTPQNVLLAFDIAARHNILVDSFLLGMY